MQDEMKDLLLRTARGAYSRRDFLSRCGALGISAAVANTLLARAAMAQGPNRGGVIRAGIAGGESTNSLDPALTASEVPFATNASWGENLVEVQADGSIGLRVAEDVSSSPDASEWTFKIRSGVEFHDGRTVTAEDVVATLRRHSAEDSRSGALGLVQGIEDMKAEGDKVVLTLSGANADLPYLMADPHLIIQPGGGYDDPEAGIGAGPYRIESFEPGVRILLSKNENYFDDSIGHADEIEIVVINDNTARTAALSAGQVHMINRVDPVIAELLRETDGVSIRTSAGSGHYVFIMHCNTAPFDNNDLRMALKLAVDREEMLDKILGGLGSIGNDFPINAAYPLFEHAIEQRVHDPALAREYYEKSGHDGSPIILRTAHAAFPGAVDAANLFAAAAQAAGIPLQVQLEPDDGYWTNVWNVEPFSASYWAGRPVQDQMYSTAYLSTADWNDTRFNNASFDELLVAARGELDLEKRTAQYTEMARIVRDEGGVIVPMFNDFVHGVRDEVMGWVDDPNAELMNRRAMVKCWLA